MRKALSVIITIISALAASSLPAAAQLAPGQWSFPPAFEGGRTTSVYPIGDKVYFLSGINIFCYNPTTKESVAYTADNRLNGVRATALFGDTSAKRLIVVYDDANIDIINSDGSVTGMSAIRDAQIAGTREIRDIVFIGSKAFIATDFGMVVVNCDTGRVTESGQYRGGSDGNISGGPVSMTVAGDRLITLFDGGHLYSSSPSDTSHSYRETDKFTYLGTVTNNNGSATVPITRIYPVGSDFIAAESATASTSRLVHKIELPWGPSGQLVDTPISGYFITKKADPWHDGDALYLLLTSSFFCRIDNSGNQSIVATLPESLSRITCINSTDDTRSSWFATPEGLMHYDLTQKPPTLLDGPHRPAVRSVFNVSRMVPNAAGDGIIIFTRSNSDGAVSAAGSIAEPLQNENFSSFFGYGYYTPGFMDLVSDGDVTDFTPTASDDLLPVTDTYYHNFAIATRERYGDILASPTGVAQNPADPQQTWIATGVEGLFRVQNGVADAAYAGTSGTAAYTPKVDNVPAVGYYGQRMYDCKFDSAGNLWLLLSNSGRPSKTGPQLIMLPAAKLSLPSSSISKSDWLSQRSDGSYLIPDDFDCDVEGSLVMLPKSKCIAVLGKYTAENLYIYRYGSNPADINSSSGVNLSTVYDQDGNAISLQFVTAAAEDSKGQLVVCSLNGIFVISSPATFDPSRDRVRRLKVNNNDGTGTASYLLNGVNVSAIDFDSAGRMWVSTEGSGVSVISSDYDEVEEQFTADNSSLPSNYVSTIALDPLTNKVYVGGTWGLGVYASEQSPGKDDYDEVRVYPNPVRPGFNGSVTVDGLMNSSLVKVVDTMGNLVYSGPSLGGTFRWNLRDINGSPVKSGVYYICPSQSDDDSGPAGKVAAKLLVIR